MDIHADRKSSEHPQVDVWYRFMSGNTPYFEEVFRKYYKQMYGYRLKLCHRRELVEGCIRELFKTLWKKRDKLEYIHSPNVYLFVSLLRKTLGMLKKRNDHQKKTGETSKAPVIKFWIEEIIVNSESRKVHRKALHEALNQLPNRQKEIPNLYFYNGKSYGEIKQILSINKQPVEGLARAMPKVTKIPVYQSEDPDTLFIGNWQPKYK